MKKPSPSLKAMDVQEEHIVHESLSRKRKRRRSPEAESNTVEMAVSDAESLKAVNRAKDAKQCDEDDIIPEPAPRSSVNSFLDLSRPLLIIIKAMGCERTRAYSEHRGLAHRGRTT
jgi:hypothetical protein